MPPDAEPVIPASADTVIASLMSGLGMALRASRITKKPGRAAITAPKPYSAAVFMDARDRKSTRLNSSHANISYAVFCLKKKKNTITRWMHNVLQTILTQYLISKLFIICVQIADYEVFSHSNLSP